VTAAVAAAGNGMYWVANVHSTPGASDRFAGWSLVVVYRLATDPMRNLVVYDGFADVNPGPRVDVNPSGFLTPPAGLVPPGSAWWRATATSASRATSSS